MRERNRNFSSLKASEKFELFICIYMFLECRIRILSPFVAAVPGKPGEPEKKNGYN